MKRGEDFFTVKDLSERLGISATGVRNLIYARKLPARKWGGRLVVLREDLERFMRSLPPAVPDVDQSRGGR